MARKSKREIERTVEAIDEQGDDRPGIVIIEESDEDEQVEELDEIDAGLVIVL